MLWDHQYKERDAARPTDSGSRVHGANLIESTTATALIRHAGSIWAVIIWIVINPCAP